jgi:hypothetical protein
MKDLVVNSSDLERARAMSRRLAQSASTAGYLKARFVRFGPAITPAVSPVVSPVLMSIEPEAPQPPLVPQVPSPQPPPPPEPPTVVAPSAPIENWDALMTWFVENTVAEAGLIVDSQGFVISTSGQVSADGFEAFGAEIYLSYEQLERIDTESGRLVWLDMEFTEKRIISLRARIPDQAPMLFAVINPSETYWKGRHVIEQVVLTALLRLG